MRVVSAAVLVPGLLFLAMVAEVFALTGNEYNLLDELQRSAYIEGVLDGFGYVSDQRS